jgi:Na+-transporting methylmalonyl-CoA/oxaloacetate decarboxylase beta subunit
MADALSAFFAAGAFAHLTWGHALMLAVGATFVYLAIARQYEPLLLLPIGFGIIVGNVPHGPGLGIGIYEPGSVLHLLYQGVAQS